MTLPAPPLRPLMTPTTPVRPMPVTTSSTPKERKQLGDAAGGAVDVVEQLGIAMKILPPLGDLALELGDAIDDGHGTLGW